MRVAFCADLHLGNHRKHGGEVFAGINRRCALSLAALERAVDTARAEQCAAFVVCGDVFDYDRPEAQLIAEVQRIFAKHEKSMRVVLLVGNHDQRSTLAGDHALGPLQAHAHVIEKPTRFQLRVTGVGTDIAIGCIPFRPEPAREWLAEAFEALGPCTMFAVHLGIADEATAPWLRGAKDSIEASTIAKLAAEQGARAVFAGNWHDPKRWNGGGVEVVQIGALVPTGFDNPGFGYGGLAIFDTELNAVDKTLNIPGPRFLKLSPGQAIDPGGNTVFAQVTVGPDEVATTPALEGAEVTELVVDREVAKAEARTAAGAAQSAETLDEALAAYLAKMPVEDGVERPEVAARVKRYLARG